MDRRIKSKEIDELYADIMVKIDNQNNLLRSQLQVNVVIKPPGNSAKYSLLNNLGPTSSRRTRKTPKDTRSDRDSTQNQRRGGTCYTSGRGEPEKVGK